MARQVALPLGTYADGTHAFGPFNLQNSIWRLGADIQRCTTAEPTVWPNKSSTVAVTLELSFDGGATWQSGGGFTAEGGIHVKADGTELPYSSFRFPVPAGTQRRVRGTLTISNGPILSSVGVTLD